MSGSSSSNGRYSVGGGKQAQAVGAALPVVERATATSLIRGAGQGIGAHSPKSQKRVNIRFIQGKARGQALGQAEATASTAQVPPNSASEVNQRRMDYGMELDTSSAIRDGREPPNVPQNSTVVDLNLGSQVNTNSLANSAVFGQVGEGTDSSICRTQISLNDMTNDFDMSPTFKRPQQVQIHEDRPSVSLNNFQKYPKKNQPAAAAVMQEKNSEKKNAIPFQSSEAHTSINKLNQNSQILYATKKKQRATDELQESKTYKIPKQTQGKFGLMSQHAAKRQAIVFPSAVKQKSNVERKFIIKLKSKESRVSRQNSSEISQEKDCSMHIEQPNPTKSQSQSRKNILKNRLIEINDRLPSVLNNYPGDKGDVSNLNTTQMSASQDLPPKQPKQLNYKKERKTVDATDVNNAQLALDRQGSSNDQHEFEEQYNYNLQLQKFHAQSQKLKSLNRIASDNLPGVANQKLINLKKTVRNNNNQVPPQQQSTHSLGQKLVQNYSCNTPKPQTLKQTILSFSSKNNSISALKKPGQSAMNRQASSNDGFKAVPAIMVNSASDLAIPSQHLLVKNKHESKTPQIKNFRVRTSDTAETVGGGGAQQSNNNQQMTARMNYYNLLGKPDIRAITSISNKGKNVANDIDFSQLDFSKKQSLIEAFAVSSQRGAEQQPDMLLQYPSLEDCKSSGDPANSTDFLYVPSLPQIVMKTMKGQVDQLFQNPTSLDTIDFSYIITQRTGSHKYLQSLIFMQQSQCVAFTLVSAHPCFRVLKQVLNMMKPHLIQLQQMGHSPTLGFLLSSCLHHLHINSSGLFLELYFDLGLLSIAAQTTPVKVENNLLSASQNIFDSFENYPFCQAILSISSCELVNTVLNLLQEKKVLLITKRVQEAAITVEAILTLLKPFRWPSGILTVLTADLIDYLDAPFPFIAGVDAAVWEQILARRGGQLDEEITTLVIETRGGDGSIMNNKMEWTLEHAAQSKGSKNCLFAFAKPFVEKLDKIKKKFLDLKVHTDASWLKLTLEIKYLFLQLMVSILSNLDSCVNKEFLQKNLEQFEESDTCETKESRTQSYFTKPTVRDVIDESKFIKLHAPDSKTFRSRLYESQLFANLLELENRMRYLLPGAPLTQQAISPRTASADTLLFVQFLTILNASSPAKQSKSFDRDWDQWSAALIDKKLKWVESRGCCKYQIGRAWPHYEELRKQSQQHADEIQKESKELKIMAMSPIKYERILRSWDNEQEHTAEDGHGRINQILQGTCPSKHEPKLRQINLFFHQRDSVTQGTDNTGKAFSSSNSKRRRGGDCETEEFVQYPFKSDDGRDAMAYNRASQPKPNCTRCQLPGSNNNNPTQRCLCSHRSSLVVSEHQGSASTHIGGPGPGLIAPKHLEHRGSYVQLNGNKFIKKKKVILRKTSDQDDEEPERTVEFGEQREQREQRHGAAGSQGNDAKIVKRVKVFQHYNLSNNLIAQENPGKGKHERAPNQPMGSLFKNTGKLRQMTEFDEDQYMEESANVPLNNHLIPFTKFNGTYDEAQKQQYRIQLLDKFSHSQQNFERTEQINSAAITDEETEDNNDQLFYQDEERASLPIASSMKPLIQQDHTTITIDHSSVAHPVDKSESMFDRIGQLIHKLWQGDEESADGLTTNQDSSQKLATQKSLNEDVQMVSMLDM